MTEQVFVSKLKNKNLSSKKTKKTWKNPEKQQTGFFAAYFFGRKIKDALRPFFERPDISDSGFGAITRRWRDLVTKTYFLLIPFKDRVNISKNFKKTTFAQK